METISTTEVSPLVNVNPFEQVKARHLVGWLLAAFPVVVIILAFTDNPLVQSVLVYLWVYGVPALWFFMRARKQGIHLAGFAGSWPQSNRWLWYPVLNIPVILLSLGSIIVIYALVAHYWPTTVEGLLSKPAGDIAAAAQYPIVATLLDALGALVLAPIVEEFIFRGFLLHRWTAKWGIVKAIIVVSIIFGILHVNFFGAALFSVVLCVVYLHTGSIWPPIILHFINNVISSWPSSQGSSEAGIQASELQASFIAGCVLVALSLPFLIWFIKVHWPKKDMLLPHYQKIKAR